MTEQEQRQAIRQILFDANDICQATPCENEYCIYHGDYRCYDNIIVDKLIEAGYGDVSEYKAENERLTNILNSLTFSKKETDIFGKPALLMFAGVKVEEAIKRVTEYNGLKAEIERLKAENEKLLDSIESVQAGRCRLRCPLTEQAVKEFAERLSIKALCLAPIETYHICNLIDELVKEIEK